MAVSSHFARWTTHILFAAVILPLLMISEAGYGASTSVESYCTAAVRGVFKFDTTTSIAVGTADVVAEDELSLVECEEEAEIDAKALLRKQGVQGGMIKVCSFRKGEQIFVGVRTIPSVKMPKNLNHSQQTKDPKK